MSQVQVADLVKLAQVDSADLFVYEVGSPVVVLEVVAQSSGFNWDPNLRPGFVVEEVEYYPYLVVETKMGPDWPKHGGIGPVVPPTPLHRRITHFGTKGIEVIGSNKTIKLDYPKAG